MKAKRFPRLSSVEICVESHQSSRVAGRRESKGGGERFGHVQIDLL